MEKTRNSVIDLFKDLFKNFCLVISKLLNGGEIDDVELTGELAKDPIKEYEASAKSVKEPVQAKTKARTPNCEKVQTREASAVKRTTRATPKEAPEPTIEPVNDDGREI